MSELLLVNGKENMHIPWVYIYKILRIYNIPLAYETMFELKQCELGKL